MFDIGFTELLVIGVVALIVVGPKDLPGMFRTLGRFTARLRSLGREFTSAMNAAADESGMREASKELKGLANPRSYGLDKLNEAADSFEKWDPTKPSKPKDGETSEKAISKGLDPDREADIAKIREATRKAGQARLDREAAEKAAAGTAKKPVKGKPPERPKPTPKPAPAAKTDTGGEVPAQDDAPAKPAAKAPATKKPAAKKAATEKPASAKKPAAAKPAARKPAAKATTARTTKARPAATKTGAQTPDKADDA
ncbi:Sec-independent protein translocase protein TatB [Maritimibacter sp. HL-12]|uniref:Sec-independent protein translocase protein TatB n=1 Tax=Maritimibacter sp. HL-12 TaxID=1162418 RepID=UPI000A0F2AB6|nr:Sec-independent protein translocase protein TatB [Maritimibacter sp. HL-12]SMH56025.1 sec-independent protein translocase protein TatB [Maritimibacter sp. HL-12]